MKYIQVLDLLLLINMEDEQNIILAQNSFL